MSSNSDEALSSTAAAPSSSSFASSSVSPSPLSSSSRSIIFEAGGQATVTASPAKHRSANAASVSTYTHPRSSPHQHRSPTGPSSLPYPVDDQAIQLNLNTPIPDHREDEAAQLARIQRAFNHWDNNKDSTISADDVAAVLSAASLPSSQEHVQSLLSIIDTDASGRITYEQFHKAYLHKLQRDRLIPPDDIDTEMQQEFHRKQVR